jgi:preprotein translocase SecF subunit
MFRFFDKANYDFLAVRRGAYIVTGTVAVIGLAVLAIRGLNESIEFTGGTMIQITARDSTISTGGIRGALDHAGLTGAEIQTFGAANVFMIRARLSPTAALSQQSTTETTAAVDSALSHTYGKTAYTVGRSSAVGPKVGGELRRKALLAVVLSFFATLVYLWFRFEWRFGLAAVAATAHDIVLTVAFISLMHLEVSLVVVAAILTIVGYSLNDTIIIFDRVRENLRKYKRHYLYQVLNRSVNETLPRTVITSGLTAVATLALLIFGGEVIRPFAWVMTFGIVTGTFSSIYIASPVLLIIEHRWPGEDARGARSLEPRS